MQGDNRRTFIMRNGWPIALASVLVLAGCGRGDNGTVPTGQVVAKAGGAEITASELSLETPPNATDPFAAAAAQQQALQSIVARKLLVGYAKENKLDKSPEAAMVINRANDLALVQLVQISLGKNVPKVSDDEVSQFVSSHPANFAQRKLLSVEQYLIPQISPELAQKLQPLDNLEQVRAALERANARFVRSAAVIDTLNLAPDAAQRISGLGVGALLMSPSTDGGLVMSQIGAIRTEPLSGAEAQRSARTMLTRERNGQQIQNAMNDIVKRGQSGVTYNAAYDPSKTAGKRGGAAPTAAPAGGAGGPN